MKKLAYEVSLLFMKTLQELDRGMNKDEAGRYIEVKDRMNLLKMNIERFNKAEKPIKVIIKLIKEDFLPNDPHLIAAFLH